MRSLRLPPEFLADLKAVAPALREESISAGFLNDLAVIHAAVLETAADEYPSEDELRFVSEQLQELRSQTQKDLRRLLDRLPDDDPLRCPISLFRTMDYGRLETAHTRALAWLLDPSKEHDFGSKLLEALLERVEGQRHPLEVRRVESEFLIDQPGKSEATGRIDVFAEGNWSDGRGKRIPWLLVLEAKIDACEGEGQLSRYEAWLESFADDRKVLRVFLTPAGRQTETAREDWFLLSFQELVETFRAASDELQDKPGYHYLRLYLAGVLRDVCRWPFPIRWDCDDPYSVLSYVKQVIDR